MFSPWVCKKRPDEEERGAQEGQVTVKGDLIINTSVGVKMGETLDCRPGLQLG